MEIQTLISQLFVDTVVITALLFVAMLFAALMAGLAHVLFED